MAASKDAAAAHLSTASGAASVSSTKLLLALLAISLGTVIEWYDYSCYSQLSKVLGKVFFPSGNAAVQAVSFWGLFAVGFISRPVGAVMFGHLGDTKGRGYCLLVSVLLMGIPTVLIGCLPSYKQIGIAAPILLALLRLAQGLAMGGEFGAAMVYLVELADPRYKALTGSLGYISLGTGVVLGILVVALTISAVPEAAMLVWGWRIPFLLSAVTLVVAAILRYNMPESSEFALSREEIDEDYVRRHNKGGSSNDGGSSADVERAAAATADKQHYTPFVELMRGYWAGLIMHSCYGAWISAAFLIGYSWLPSFLVQHTGIDAHVTLWMVLSGMIVFTAMVPLAGILSDKGLPRLTTTIAIALVSAAAAVPMFMGFQRCSLALSWVIQVLLLAMAGFAMGMLPAVVSAIYPAGVRISGCNLGVNMSSTIGGVCPLIITALQTATHATFLSPALVLAATGVITVIASLLLIRFYPQANRAMAA